MKLAILTSHPIQYQTPLFRQLAEQEEVDLTVYFCWNFGIQPTLDPQLNVPVQWDIPMLEGYQSYFLKNLSPRPSSDFWGQINPSIILKLTQERYDAVLIYGWNSFTNWMALILSFILRIPIVMHGESSESDEPKGVKLLIKKMVLSTLFRVIHAFLVIGKQNKCFYLGYGVSEAKMVSVPYAIDNDRFMSYSSIVEENKEMYRSKCGIPVSSVVILFVGKLTEKKRPFDLFFAFEKVLKNNLTTSTSLVFVGDGKLRKDLEEAARRKGIATQVVFRGFCNQKELPMWYAIADIFVLPSGKGETWGLVVNEAMCAKLPVIVSNTVGCADDLVSDGINGFRYSCGDVDQLAIYLNQLILNKDMRREYGRESHKRIQAYSHWHDVQGILSAIRSFPVLNK